jgi:ADP-L-glycero-D-manno-heptose 6-epimerase
MIVITGAEGFIGSCLVRGLNEAGYNDLILVDDFSTGPRAQNLIHCAYSDKVDRKAFMQWLSANANQVQFIFHIGARTDTTEKDEAIFKELNLDFSQQLWKICVQEGLPLVYASSAATYGNGEHGYDDNEAALDQLQPMNPYGRSKNDFDKWALAQTQKPYFWAGLKFFNVYGPNEYHKGRMASVVFHAFHQIKDTGKVNLFRSHRPDYQDGEQKRDFIFVKDLVSVCLFLMHQRKHSGLYNLGTGNARTWNELAKAIFGAMQQPVNIEYIDIPEDIRETYQYFTEAKMTKLIDAGYDKPFTSIEDGIAEYVRLYLLTGNYY